MPTMALTHEQVLKKICGVCRRKQKSLENISPTYLSLIQKFHHAGYDLTNGMFPTVICPGCKKILRDGRSSELTGSVPKRNLPENMYSLMSLDTRVSRSETNCQCSWCGIWRLNGMGGDYKDFSELVRDAPGQPRKYEAIPPPEVKNICQGCGGERKRGVRHTCNVSTLENNAARVLQSMPSTSQQRVTARSLDYIREELGVGKNGTMELKTMGPNPKTINFGKPKEQNRVTKEDLMRIKSRLDLSGNQTLLLRTAIRTVFGRRSVEEGAAEYQKELNHRLGSYFQLTTLSVKKTAKKAPTTFVDRPTVYCSDFEGLLKFLLEMRIINPDEMEVLVGFDDGQGFLKLMMLLLSLQDRSVSERKR